MPEHKERKWMEAKASTLIIGRGSEPRPMSYKCSKCELMKTIDPENNSGSPFFRTRQEGIEHVIECHPEEVEPLA